MLGQNFFEKKLSQYKYRLYFFLTNANNFYQSNRISFNIFYFVYRTKKLKNIFQPVKDSSKNDSSKNDSSKLMDSFKAFSAIFI